MAIVNADPEKLKQLAKTFTSSASQLEQVARAMRRALDQSGWNDSERQKFEVDFSATVKTLNQFTEKLKGQYAIELNKKAASLDQYGR